ncbi:N-acetylglucosaminyltransferase [Streptomyces sp. WAC 06738]|uniref:glycosyltransferase family 2 protein n=1 Tax=Streptomyces sp. WAC 06738 TaxID=2203210 RepID=UPI000F70E3F1|nr:glycosyltransferase family 2 protein [Streptomyces sp. WAC 06738]AZM45834.1 N-acetylglucosaminyltransferase [Streptomyces sp. WAC 06738]
MTQAESGLAGQTVATGGSRTAAAGSHEDLRARILALSDGNVVRIPAGGPTFGRPSPSLRTRAGSFAPVFSRADRRKVTILVTGWLVCLVWFWVWWLQPAHRIGWVGFLVNSALLMYLSLMPLHFLVPVLRLRRFSPAIGVPHVRAAFVVTRAPSEQWELARGTLLAMLAQDFPYPYDVWLCDEDPSAEVLQWCAANGVRVSCRRGRADYHRATWPRRTRCKEGNLAFFYDHWGYRDYDVVSQLDCDHVPHRSYLTEVIRPFADPAVGYVAAPSVCDANAAASWSARGRLHREAMFHGAVQLGHSEGLAPVCIGSHYAVRTRALRDIGGIGPELAEDFSTAFLLNSAGWQGAFAIDAEAHGDGPITFAAMATQEFQWSRSLAVMMMDLVPRHLGRMSGWLRARFVLALSYYPLLALTSTVGLTLPPVAAVTGLPWIDVNYFAFLGHFWAMTVWMVLLALMMRRRGLLRPRDAPVVSWENWLFSVSRWPFVVWGVGTAVLQRLRPRTVVFKVTPKSRDGLEPLPLRLVAPHLFIASVLTGAAIVGELTGPAVGYVFLCLAGAVSYALVTLVVAVLHVAETARAAGVRFRRALGTAGPPLLAGAALLVPLAWALSMYPVYLAGVIGW